MFGWQKCFCLYLRIEWTGQGPHSDQYKVQENQYQIYSENDCCNSCHPSRGWKEK